MTDLTTPENHMIVVPVDFSPSSNNALEYAIEMAKLFNNKILLVYAMHESKFASIFTGSDNKKLLQEGISAKLDEYKKNIVKIWPNARVETRIDEGKPYKVIEQITEDPECDLVVMGTNGASGIDVFIGSTTRRVMSSANVPVVAVKEKRENPSFNNIVLPIDLTKTSKQKVDWAIKLAKKFNSTIHVIMEVEKDEFLKNKVQANLTQIEGVLRKNGIKYVAKLLDDLKYPDNIGQDTVQYAEEVDADLIIIMTQQEVSGVSQIFIGNYAEQVVNSAQRTPVMSINPKKTTKFEGSVGFY